MQILTICIATGAESCNVEALSMNHWLGRKTLVIRTLFPPHPNPAMGRTVKCGRILSLLVVFLHIRNGLCFSLCLSFASCIRLRFGSPSLAAPRSLGPGLTCYPCSHTGAHHIVSKIGQRSARNPI